MSAIAALFAGISLARPNSAVLLGLAKKKHFGQCQRPEVLVGPIVADTLCQGLTHGNPVQSAMRAHGNRDSARRSACLAPTDPYCPMSGPEGRSPIHCADSAPAHQMCRHQPRE